MKTNLLKGGKRLLSIILAICLMASVCSTGISFSVSAAESTGTVASVDYWDGSTTLDTTFVSGTGDEKDPYIITTAQEVYSIMNAYDMREKYFKVADGVTDLYFNQVEGMSQSQSQAFFEDSTKTKNVWKNASDWYLHFDGNGVTIHGLYQTKYNNNTSYGVGFIGFAGADTTVKNTNFNNCYFTDAKTTETNYGGAGVVIGATASRACTVTVDNVKITNCTVIGDGSAAAAAGDAALVCGNKGQHSAVKISNVVNYGNSLTGTAQVGILVGGGWKGGTSDSFEASNIISMDNVAIVSNTSYLRNTGIGTYDFVYTYADIPSNLAIDTKGIYSVSTLDEMTGIAWNLEWFVDESGYPYFVDSDIKYEVWDGTAASSFSDTVHTGTSTEDAIIINSAEELAYMVKSGGSGKYYKVSDDIDLFLMNSVYGMTSAEAATFLADNGKPWYNYGDVTNFTSKFNGNGATIIGLYGKTTADATAFISRPGSGALVENVKFDTCYFESIVSGGGANGNGSASVVFGFSRNSAATAWVLTAKNCEITNCKVKGTYASTLLLASAWGTSLVAENIVTSNNDIFDETDAAAEGITVSASLKNQNGVLIGDVWTWSATDAKLTATNLLSVDESNIAGNKISAGLLTCEKVYAKQKGSNHSSVAGITAITNTKGYGVYSASSALDWTDVFTVNDGEYPQLKLFAFGEERLYSGGTGTEADPYLISNAVDLQYMVQFNGYVPVYDAETDTYTIGTTQAYHKLTNDIDINGVKDMTTAEAFAVLDGSDALTWRNIDYTGTNNSGVFAGVVDGDRHAIYGLKPAGSNATYTGANGMFRKLGGATFKNLAIRKSITTNSGSAAAIFSPTASAGVNTFYNCAVTDCRIYTTATGWGGAAGFVALGNGGQVTFEKCLFAADEVATIGIADTITTANNATFGGFAAIAWTGTRNVTDCISIGAFPIDSILTEIGHCCNTNGLQNYNNVYTDYDIATKAADVYTTLTDAQKAILTNVNYIPTGATEQDEKMWLDVDYDTYLAHDTWGGADGVINPADFTKSNYKYWDGTPDTAWEGNGTENSPYILYTAEEVYGMVTSGGMVEGKACYFKIADQVIAEGGILYFNPIKGMSVSEAQTYLANPANNWAPNVSDFNGHFDGNGATLAGLANTSDEKDSIGFIPRLNQGSATVKNVTFDRCYFNNTKAVTNWHSGAGIVIGGMANTSAVNNVVIDNVVVKDSYANSAKSTSAVLGSASTADVISISDVLTYGNTLTGHKNSTGSITGEVYNYTSISIANILSADTATVVANTGNLNPSSNHVIYDNVYSVTAKPGNIGTVDEIALIDAASTTGEAVISAASGLPWYDGWMPGGEGEYPYFGSLGYRFWTGNASASLQTWDGTDTNAGTASNPYKLTTAEDVYYAIKSGGNGKYYKVADEVDTIYFAPIKGVENTAEVMEILASSAKEWAPAASASSVFNGTIDGNGATFAGLYNSESTLGLSTAFIPVYGEVTVKDLTFDKCYFEVNIAAGNLNSIASVVLGCTNASNNVNVTVQSVIVKNSTVNSDNTHSNGAAALVVGGSRGKANDDAAITVSHVLTYGNTLSGTTITGSAAGSYTGALMGYNYPVVPTTLRNSIIADVAIGVAGKSTPSLTASAIYKLGTTPTSTSVVNANVGYLPSDTVITGAAAKTNMPGLSWGDGWMVGEEGEYPYFGSYDYDFWRGDATAIADLEGDGTEDVPYILKTAEDVAGMVQSGGKVDGKAAYFKVKDGVTALYFNPIKDMDKEAAMSYLAASGRQWNGGASTFDGYFDGNGATLIGLTSTASSGFNAFINVVAHGSAASVKNVTFDRCYFVSTGTAANASWGHGAGVIFGKVGGTSAASGVNPANVAVSKVIVKNSTVTSNGGAAIIIGFGGNTVANIDFVLTENNTVTTANTHANATTAASTVLGGAGTGFRNNDVVKASSLSNCIFTEADIEYFPAAAYANGWFGIITAVYTAGTNDLGNKAGTATQDQMKGAAAETNMPNLAWGAGFLPGAEGEYPVFGSYDYTFWNGTADKNWAGSGIENDPYIIENAQQLYGMVQSGGMVDGKSAYFKVKDGVDVLYLTAVKGKTVAETQTFLSTRGINWYDGTTDTEFVGKFDGNGVRLIGMKSVNNTIGNFDCGVGFVERLGANAVIKNVHFDMPYVTTTRGSAATITTYTTGKNIMVMNVAVTNAYVANGAVTNDYSGVAGILYQHDSHTPMTLANCLFEGTLVNNNPNTNESATNNTAGIVATPDSWGSGVIVDNCISIGYKPVGANTLSYTVFNTYTTVACDTTGVIANTPVANLTKELATSLSWNNWKEKAFEIKEKDLVLPMPTINESWSSDNWNVKAATTSIISNYSIFDGGNGTEAKPYGISTPEQLYKAIFSGGERYGAPLYFRLTKNIDLGGGTWLTSNITGYVPFSGVLDGNGHTVKGFTSVGENAGLIPVAVGGAVIKDIHLENAYASATNAAGALVGTVSGDGTIEVTNISVINGDVSGATAGGIIGVIGANATATITNAYFIGTATDGFVGSGTATVKSAYTTAASVFENAENKVYTEVKLGKIKASQLGDDWYQGDYTLFFPRLKSWAKSQKTFDMAGDGETSSYNAEDLAAMRSNLLYRSAFKSIYGDITFDGKIDIRDLAILKRSAAGSYADIDEGFWPNVAQGEYTIVYENNDNRDAAYGLQNYFAEKFGVEPSVVYTQAEGAVIPEAQIIAVGDVASLDLKCTNQSVPTFGLDTSMHKQEGNYIIWFNSAFVTGVEETVDLFKQYAEVNKSLPEIEGSFWEGKNYVKVTLDGEELLNLDAETGYKSYKQLKWIDGVKYNYVWGDEFDQTYDTNSTVSDAYGYDHNTWKVSHSLNFHGDIEVAMPEDIQNFTYVKDGKLVMRNDVTGNYWTKYRENNGFDPGAAVYNGIVTVEGTDIKYATGGTFDTSRSMYFKRGYAELSAQVPNDDNVWPAWWLYGNANTSNSSIDNSLLSKIYEINEEYDGKSDAFDPTNVATYKYKVPMATIEIDIFEVMNTAGGLFGWYGNKAYGATVHKRYKSTVKDSVIYDTFGTGEVYSPNVSGYTTNTNTATEQSWVKRDPNSYDTAQTYSQRTYYFLWDENQLTFWDSDNTTKKRTIDISGDSDYDIYLYMLFDNHFYSPNSGNYYSGGGLPEQELIVDYVRLYQAAGKRALITPESKAINGTDN